MPEWITGRNPVYEALTARRRRFYQLWAAQGAEQKGRLQEIFQLAVGLRLLLKRVPRQELDGISQNHQGIALQASGYPYSDLPAILAASRQSLQKPFFLILDMLQDPQNLGTLLRTAEAVGVQGVFITAHQAVGVTPAVVHASSGACEHLLIAAGNLAQTMAVLKEAGIWLMGLENSDQAEDVAKIDLDIPLALVVGSEGGGLRQLVRRSCDRLIRLPTQGRVESLNAAVAGSIVLFLANQARVSP